MQINSIDLGHVAMSVLGALMASALFLSAAIGPVGQFI